MENSITYKGVEYALAFNLNVMEDIQTEYGSVDKWGELTDGEEPNAKAVKFGITKMINEWIDIYNEEHEEKRDFVTEKFVGRMVYEIGLEASAKAMNETIIDSTKSDEKN